MTLSVSPQTAARFGARFSLKSAEGKKAVGAAMTSAGVGSELAAYTAARTNGWPNPIKYVIPGLIVFVLGQLLLGLGKGQAEDERKKPKLADLVKPKPDEGPTKTS